jgi:hypothetical protein
MEIKNGLAVRMWCFALTLRVSKTDLKTLPLSAYLEQRFQVKISLWIFN